MGNTSSDPLSATLTPPLLEHHHHPTTANLIQAILILLPCAFDSQQCFITAFTDSPSYPSNIITDYSLSSPTSLPSASFFLGSLLGGFILTPLADTSLGRKNLLLLSTLITSLSALLTAFFATNLFLYSSLRFACGFGRASIITCALVLVGEIVYRRWRSQVSIIGYFMFTFGFVSLPGIAYLNRDLWWRYMYLWTSVPSLLYCFVIYFCVNESPRWLSLRSATAPVNVYSALPILFSRKWVFHRMLLMMVICFGMGMIYYGMPLALGGLSYNLYISVAMEALMEIPASLAALFLINSVNRKPSLIITTTLSGIFSIICGAATSSTSAQLGMELLSFLIGTTSVDIALIYVSELFPTSVRNSALAMARQAVLVGGMLGAVLAAQTDEFVVFGVFGMVILVCGVFVVGLPETMGMEISDTMDEEERKLMKNSVCLIV